MDKKVVMLIAQGFRDEELLQPMNLMKENGVHVVIAAKTKGVIQGSMGTEVSSNIVYNEINPDYFNAIIFVGGLGAQTYFKDPIALNLAKTFYEKKKIVAAICVAPAILANAGILKGRYVTGHASESSTLRQSGALYTGEDVNEDQRIVTAKGPQVSLEFGKKVLHSLGIVIKDKR